jgi:S-adenosylmethionine:tRNA ribosyltransferase-isomerase
MRVAASRPPEHRGLTRDGVRLLAATPDGLSHATFADLARYLRPGDLLIVNTSGTIPAAVDGSRDGGQAITVDFSTPLDDGTWLVELRENSPDHARVLDASPGDVIALPGGMSVTLLCRYPESGGDRMWAASVDAPGDITAALARHGRPIRYSYVPDPWPLPAYQTVFARDPGSAEMPSAGRPFTGHLVASLIASGVTFAPITLHAGVASLETGEPPLPERYSVPEPTAALINLARQSGRRVVAVGTTCTRAVESAADAAGTVRASRGWTDLVLGLDRPARVVNGLITGWHDPEASHLALLSAVAGSGLVSAAYAEAERAGYLWHEFGDSCILLPPRRAPRSAETRAAETRAPLRPAVRARRRTFQARRTR